MHHLVAELRAAGAQLTSAEVLLVHGEAVCALDVPAGLRHRLTAGEHPSDLARPDAGPREDRVRRLLAVRVEDDDGALWKAEVSAKVVDTLHPPFTGIVY